MSVANRCDVLVIAPDILGFNDSAEIITLTFAFFTSSSCIARLGDKQAFCDVDEDTFCMDMNDAEIRITKNTVGLLPVHLFLQTADMSACLILAKQHNLKVS